MSEAPVAAPREVGQQPSAEWVGLLADALAEERDRRKRIESRAGQAVSISAGGLALVAVMQGLAPTSGAGFNSTLGDLLAAAASILFITAMVFGIWSAHWPTRAHVAAVGELRRINGLIDSGANAHPARSVALCYIDQLDYLRSLNDALVRSKRLQAVPVLMVLGFGLVAAAFLVG